MELQKYRLFVDLAETGNLTRTGERMGYTQSGVSRFLKAMEGELGFPLFTRTRRGLTLTAAGQVLLVPARELLQCGARVEQTVRALNGVETGTVNVGALEEVSARLLPGILERFRQEAPNVAVRLREGSARQLQSWMQDGTVDFALCTRCAQAEWEPLWSERLLAVTGRSHPWRGSVDVTAEELTEQPLVLLSRETGEEAWRMLEGSGRPFQVAGETESVYTALELLRRGLGRGILPEPVVSGVRELSARPLRPGISRSLGLCVRSAREVSPAARQLMACIRRQTDAADSAGRDALLG